jgi:hypothetical protein
MYSSRPPKGPQQQQQQQYNNSNNNNNNNNNKMGSGSGGGGNNNNSGSGGGGGGVGNPVGANNIINTIEACERIKEEYTFIQSQNQSLKLELEKLSLEKTEMQRHYVMYYEMSYGLNVEMHKQTEIAKRLSAICAQLVPYLSQEHQQQVSAAIERAKQVTMSDLNSIIGQQIHAQQFPHIGHGGGGQGGQGGGGGLPAHLAGLAGMAGGGLPGGFGLGLGGAGGLPLGLGGPGGGGPQIPPPPGSVGSGLLALGSVAGALVQGQGPHHQHQGQHQHQQQQQQHHQSYPYANSIKDEKDLDRTANFDVFNMLYVICDKNKAKFPPNEIHIYELFLFQANNNNKFFND